MPAGSETSGQALPSLPRTWRPLGVRIAVIFFGLMLFAVCAAAWFGFDDETRAKFDILQRLTLLVMAAGTVTVGWALGRARVTAEIRRSPLYGSPCSSRSTWSEARSSAPNQIVSA